MKRVYILVGVPGSGKTTFIKNELFFLYAQCTNTNAVVCSADHYFERTGKYIFDGSKLPIAHRECMEKFELALSEGVETIFVDNTNIRFEHRQPYIDKATAAGYEVVMKVLSVRPKDAFERNIHGVPLASIERMHNVLVEQGLIN